MNRSETTRPNRDFFLWWPILFGGLLTIDRLLVLSVLGTRTIDPKDLGGLLLGALSQVACGFVLALVLFLLRFSMARAFAHLTVGVVVFLNVAAFHYEAVFWRLPGISLLYYVREAGHLASSAEAHAPWLFVVLELVVLVGLLVMGAERMLDSEPRSGDRHVSAAALIVCAATFGVAIWTHLFMPAGFSHDMQWRVRAPILWALQSWSMGRSYEVGDLRIDRGEVIRFQETIGHRIPFGGDDPTYPLCGSGPRFPGRSGNGRSVIFLILESVGVDEMALRSGEESVMPALNRIASESLSFGRIKASGTKSIQAMPSLFAGVPPQPASNLLWREPLNRLEGFPYLLRTAGYETAYFHGGDLSFEQQRQFVRMVGFEEINELDFFEGHPFLGWGFSDDVVFDKLESWVDEARTAAPGAPYLATLFTLSTHDPYIVPEGRKRVFTGEGLAADFVESLRFLDEQLASFYAWYLENEAPRGTVLVITGDHAPHLSGDVHIEDDQVTRFDVPLIVHGVDSERLERASTAATRLGGHFDIPATLLGLLELSPSGCDQGVDLLTPDEAWPDDRVVYSVGGDELEDFYVWFSDADVHLELATRSVEVSSAGTASLGQATIDERKVEAIELAGLSRKLSGYLVSTDGFAPPPPTVRNMRSPLPRVQRPIFVSHRGQSRGEVESTRQNKADTIALAIEDGFEWVEVDIQLTADEVPVLLHDPFVSDDSGRKVEVSTLTLAELRDIPGQWDVVTLREAAERFGSSIGLLIEIKPQPNLRLHTAVVFRSAEIVRSNLDPERVTMDSFSPFVAASLAQQCECQVGQDAPYGRAIPKPWLDDVVLRELDWIYLHHTQSSPELIRDAHEKGLKVLVYTVNDVEEIRHLDGEWPDAIITDRSELVAEFDRLTAGG